MNLHLNHQDRLLLGRAHAFQIFVPAQAVQHQATHAVAVECARGRAAAAPSGWAPTGGAEGWQRVPLSGGQGSCARGGGSPSGGGAGGEAAAAADLEAPRAAAGGGPSQRPPPRLVR